MTPKQRNKRLPLPRTAPNRGWTGAFGRHTAQPEGDAADRIGNGVGLGYRVIDEYIELGRNAAQAFSAAMPHGWGAPPVGGPTGSSPSPWAALGGVPPFDPSGFLGGSPNGMPNSMPIEDLGRMWFQAWQQWLTAFGQPANWMQDPNGLAGRGNTEGSTEGSTAGTGPPPFEDTRTDPEPPPAPAQSADHRVRLQIETSQLTDCAVNLSASSGTLALHELRATDPDLPRLSDCRITREHDEWVVHISIPQGQPEAFYSGIIVDEATSLPRGSVWVRIGATLTPAG